MEQIISAFVSTLLFSLVAGALLAIVQGASLLALRKTAPAIRYNLLLVLFFVFLSSCGVVFIEEIIQPEVKVMSVPLLQGLPGMTTNMPVGVAEPEGNGTLISFLSQLEMPAFVLWSIFFGVKLLGFIRDWRQIRRIKNNAWKMNDSELERIFVQLCQKLSISKKVTLKVTAHLHGPTVVGFLRPVILMPLSLVNAGLTPAQIEAILLHELAHIRRFDYLVNFFQAFADTIFFFNPFYLWISRSLRREREYCCDQFVVNFQGTKQTYLQSLVAAYEVAMERNNLAVGFSGASGPVIDRVERIMEGRYPSIGYMPCIGFAIIVAALAGHLLYSTVDRIRLPVNGITSHELAGTKTGEACTNPNHINCNKAELSDTYLQLEQRKILEVSSDPVAKAILQQLLQHQIISRVEGTRFLLTRNEMIVNGVVRVDCVFEQLASQYLSGRDRLSFSIGE